jgi:hypothetical protein
MQKKLQTQYILMVVPAVFLFLVFGLVQGMQITASERVAPGAMVPVLVFIVSTITAIAGPLFLRTLFAHSVKEQHKVKSSAFLSFQRRLLWVSQTTPYLAFVAVLCNFPRFYAAAIVLMGLYALYYYYPSQRRIGFDKKMFRVT